MNNMYMKINILQRNKITNINEFKNAVSIFLSQSFASEQNNIYPYINQPTRIPFDIANALIS